MNLLDVEASESCSFQVTVYPIVTSAISDVFHYCFLTTFVLLIVCFCDMENSFGLKKVNCCFKGDISPTGLCQHGNQISDKPCIKYKKCVPLKQCQFFTVMYVGVKIV